MIAPGAGPVATTSAAAGKFARHRLALLQQAGLYHGDVPRNNAQAASAWRSASSDLAAESARYGFAHPMQYVQARAAGWHPQLPSEQAQQAAIPGPNPLAGMTPPGPHPPQLPGVPNGPIDLQALLHGQGQVNPAALNGVHPPQPPQLGHPPAPPMAGIIGGVHAPIPTHSTPGGVPGGVGPTPPPLAPGNNQLQAIQEAGQFHPSFGSAPVNPYADYLRSLLLRMR